GWCCRRRSDFIAAERGKADLAKLAAVSRVLNEDDIIEAFVRHHAPLIDHHVLLDNGSVDRTVEILSKLAAAGLALSVFSNRAPIFSEQAFNTFLYRYAIEEQQADGVIFLDSDEFLDLRRIGIGLRMRLAELPKDRPGLRIRVLDYHSSSTDNAKDLLVPRRVHLRERMPGSTGKLFMRRLVPSWKVMVDVGNHKASFDGKELSFVPERRIMLAHFSDRGRWRWLSRVAIGRLKVLAAGRQEVAQNRNGQ
ncbi:MAG: glycosyltransferase family 2 protein, partial [Acetobacteraceae bacterium]